MTFDGFAFETPDIRETQHPSPVASRVPDFEAETNAPQDMVNDDGEDFETVSGVDTCAGVSK